MIGHDVVIIGASLAGAACLRELCALGIDAIAFERDRFPRPKVCGGFLSPGAVDDLAKLGILDQVLAAGAVPVTSAHLRVRDTAIEIPFERQALGISRNVLDSVVACGVPVEQGRNVRKVTREGDQFFVDGLRCRAVIDASGKLGRFTRRITADEFGIQYTEETSRGSVLDFWFFTDGYGGAVSIEENQSNYCFLVRKDAVNRYVSGRDCLVTGPLAYDRIPGDYIAIGDAAGMMDPFCGDGMHHALASGMLAASVVADGIRRGRPYEEMKCAYESRWERRWGLRRVLGGKLRGLQKYFGVGLRFAPSWLVNRIWERSPISGGVVYDRAYFVDCGKNRGHRP